MNEKIKQKAEELYPIESHANEHTAFLQGANEMGETIRLGLAEIMEQCSIEELTEICNCKDIEPIPLTDELIEKQGWEKVCYYYTDKNGLEIYETNDGWHLHIDDDKCQTTIAILIKYVHELQNAYFVVTKKELEVKL